MSAIDGRKAKVVNKGERYAAYDTFAKQFGHPDAAVMYYQDDQRKPLRNGDIVTLLVGGDHLDRPYEGLLWVVEAANGEKHIINEKGLRILGEKITVLTDELGLDREYREVNRKARVGELVKSNVDNPPIFKVTAVDEVTEGDASGGADGIPTMQRNYVVLEPTDVVRINGERFRLVERKANVGERVAIVGNTTNHCFSLGSTTLIKQQGKSGRVRGEDDRNGWLEHDNYRVLEPLGSTSDAAQPNIAGLVRKSHEQQAQIDGLTETVAKLTYKLSKVITQLRVAQEDIVLIEEGVLDDLQRLRDRVTGLERGQAPKEAPEPVAVKTLTRDEIIDKAKVDVAKLKRIGGDRYATLPSTSSLCGKYYDVKFQINRKKKTVVALVYGGISRTLYSRGIAKCAPGDVFNVYIGMAIALRRALGLDIPQEYVNAPQPDEPRVGDVVIKTVGFDAGVAGVVEQVGATTILVNQRGHT